MFLSQDWTLGWAPGRTNFDAGSTGSLTHYLPRQGEDPACTQNGLAIRHADPLREYQRARAAQQHGFTLQPGTEQGLRQVIRIQADGGEETRHPGQIEATNPKRQIGKSRQHAAMGHVLAVAVALFNTEPESKRPVISADHDGADGFQKRASGGARHEAFRNGGGGSVIQGRATFGLNRGRKLYRKLAQANASPPLSQFSLVACLSRKTAAKTRKNLPFRPIFQVAE